MRPFERNTLTKERYIFNYRLARARRVVENIFDILTNYWRIYHHHIYLNPDNVTALVKATIVLHKILTLQNDKVCTDIVDNRVDDVRNYFTDYFYSDHGSVEWQNDCP